MSASRPFQRLTKTAASAGEPFSFWHIGRLGESPGADGALIMAEKLPGQADHPQRNDVVDSAGLVKRRVTKRRMGTSLANIATDAIAHVLRCFEAGREPT